VCNGQPHACIGSSPDGAASGNWAEFDRVIAEKPISDLPVTSALTGAGEMFRWEFRQLLMQLDCAAGLRNWSTRRMP
jgi:hypothetical protein